MSLSNRIPLAPENRGIRYVVRLDVGGEIHEVRFHGMARAIVPHRCRDFAVRLMAARVNGEAAAVAAARALRGGVRETLTI